MSGALVLSLAVSIQGAPPLGPPPPDADIHDTTISELKQLEAADGWFRVEGVVIELSDCPPCPPDATCAPWPGNRITISEKLERPERYPRPARQIDVNLGVQNAKGTFRVGKRYVFAGRVDAPRATTAAAS